MTALQYSVAVMARAAANSGTRISAWEARNPRSTGDTTWGSACAPEGIRTPNLLIRSQMLYPLSYGRMPVRDGRDDTLACSPHRHEIGRRAVRRA